MRSLTTLVALVCSVGLQAQVTSPTTGGDATGTGGSSSYTVGQVVYTTDTSSSGSVAKGVQQPYEISIVTGVKETTINLEMIVYPNPTTNYLNLSVKDVKLTSTYFQLIDVQGKVLKKGQLKELNTKIKMENLPKAIYLLKVHSNNTALKTFRIVKN